MKQKKLKEDIKNNSGIVINIRGSNASGKSTIVKQFIKRYDFRVCKINGSYVTYISDLDIYILGRYDVSSGGCDRYSGVNEVYCVIMELIKHSKPSAIIYEGMLYGKTFKSTYLLHKYIAGYFYKLVCITLVRDFRNVIKLLEIRNCGKDFDTVNVLKTYESVFSSSKKLKENGVKVYFEDVDSVKKENMWLILKNVLSKEGVDIGKAKP